MDSSASGSPIEFDEDILSLKANGLVKGKDLPMFPLLWDGKKEKDMEIPLDVLRCEKFPNL